MVSQVLRPIATIKQADLQLMNGQEKDEEIQDDIQRRTGIRLGVHIDTRSGSRIIPSHPSVVEWDAVCQQGDYEGNAEEAHCDNQRPAPFAKSLVREDPEVQKQNGYLGDRRFDDIGKLGDIEELQEM
jgi:hypothetical protein